MVCACMTIRYNVSVHQEPHVTQVIPRSFAPEFSHFFDVSIPFCQGSLGTVAMATGEGGNHGAGLGVVTMANGAGLLARELLQGSLLLEVWHQVPPRAEPNEKGGVIGQRLGPSFQDVLLGVAHVPLKGLLRHTGMYQHGGCHGRKMTPCV